MARTVREVFAAAFEATGHVALGEPLMLALDCSKCGLPFSYEAARGGTIKPCGDYDYPGVVVTTAGYPAEVGCGCRRIAVAAPQWLGGGDAVRWKVDPVCLVHGAEDHGALWKLRLAAESGLVPDELMQLLAPSPPPKKEQAA